MFVGVGRATTSPRMLSSPAAILSSPKTARASSDLPQPTSPATPTISPARTLEAHVREPPVCRTEVAHLQHLLACRRGDLGKEGVDLAPRHHLDELRLFHVARLDGVDLPAVAQHRDPVADPANLVDAMRDVDDADPFALEPLDQGEELVGLAFRQGGGGLVQNEELEVLQQGLRDLGHLLLGPHELTDTCARAKIEAQVLQDGLGLRAHCALAQHPPAGLLTPEEEVLLDRQVRERG